jgi:hypothetical protein
VIFRAGEIVRLTQELGRFRAGEFFVYLRECRIFGTAIVLTPDGRQAGILVRYLGRPE